MADNNQWRFAWLIERQIGGQAAWRSMTSFKPEAGWTHDSNDAMQFARQKDAEDFITADAGDGEIYSAKATEHGFSRTSDTWPMCEADTDRMEKAAIAIETLTREREAAFNIATRRTEEHMEFQRQRDALAQALRNLTIGYVALLESAHRRIIDAGGSCDSVARMEAGDPYLREARTLLAAAKYPESVS